MTSTCRGLSVPLAGLAVALSIASFPCASTAQEIESQRLVLRGVVVDGATGEPLHGAFVAPAGSQTGYLTHENGSFALPVFPDQNYHLYAELIGYETVQFVVAGREPEPFVVSLRPDPIKLEGIRVLANRFETRRRGIAVQVRALEREDLIAAPTVDVVDFMQGRFGLSVSFCGGGAGGFGSQTFGAGDCILRRGRWVQPRVYIDEVPAFGGLDELRTYRPQDLYTLEVYDRGTLVLAYTHHFIDRVLDGRRRLMPLVFLR